MKRSPLHRKTPLSRGEAGWTTSSASPRRTRLNPVSKRRAKLNRQRTAVLEHVREFQTWCSMCGKTGVGLDAHELKSRAQGGSLIDLENIVLLCRDDHNWVTTHPKEAAELGWAISKKWGPSE